ncbi:MAG: FliI/YscN family ATPase [Planctomycetota bacterium]
MTGVSMNLNTLKQTLKKHEPLKYTGRVTRVVGVTVECTGIQTALGNLCRICFPGNRNGVLAELVGFKEDRSVLMPLDEPDGIGPGSEVIPLDRRLGVKVGPFLLGRLLDGLGRPIDGLGEFPDAPEVPVTRNAPMPLERASIREPMQTGIRSIDGFMTLGKGQRIGIFSGSGVGKSTLLGKIARESQADINVIALMGERGREVRAFIEDNLGEEGLARSVVVAATSDRSPLMRFKGAFVATAIAEYFRDLGKDVMLMMDSVTRFAMSAREIGLAMGEPPTAKSYPPSLFSHLPKLFERLGNTAKGSITGIYTVLVEGDDLNDPVADSARSLLDGHIVLSRELANRFHYPAVDVLSSVSRIMDRVVDASHLKALGKLREILATYAANADLINIGAYRAGSSPLIDKAIAMIGPLNTFLKQDTSETSSFEDTVSLLLKLIESK